MKFARVNGQRQEPQRTLSGECPCCGDPMIARCGDVRVWHWAHRGRRHCDPWWENETDWHRDWKDQFPRDWQEVVHHAEDGERHIADVKTSDGRAIEFQHSYIKPEERRSREAFYPKLVWVIDGLRRKTDKERFQKAWERGRRVDAKSDVRAVPPKKSALLRDWVASSTHAFIDFGEEQVLWWLSDESDDSCAYLAPFPRAEFIELYRRPEASRARERELFRKNYTDWVRYDRRHREESGALTRWLGIERDSDGIAPWSKGKG